ncbi:MAG: GDP-mannose 4,6-dehydratase [Verrucomicrobia bacterium]|nr:GDP-mannose 4,6-dehydratase [Verrucomicrobiota bacterium]
MKVLVTGGAGFIGSHLVEALVWRGATVAVLDDFNPFYDPAIKRENLSQLNGQVRIHQVDICDAASTAQVVATEKPELIFHLAARAGVRPSVLQPELYLRTNITGTFNLLEAAKAAGVPRLIFASSSSVYGANRTLPFTEDQVLTQTLSPYASTKLAGEQLCSNYSYLYGLQIICLRFFTVYGPRQRPDLSIHRFTDLIYHGKPIEVYGDGSARRDFTYVDDTVQGILNAVDYKDSPFEIINLGESQTVTLTEVIASIEQALGRKAEINYLPVVPGDMPVTYADIRKARQLLGYTPTTSIHEGIPRFIDWYLARTRKSP